MISWDSARLNRGELAAALVSAATGESTSAGLSDSGEVGQSGEIRKVWQAEGGLKEAQKPRLEQAILPRRVARGGQRLVAPKGMNPHQFGCLFDLVVMFNPESK